MLLQKIDIIYIVLINITNKMEITSNNMKSKSQKKSTNLHSFFESDPTMFEIGVDEAGRGPLFGRVYTAAVILPKDESFEHFNMKDSKRFHSKKKIQEVAEYIKSNAIAWAVTYEDEKTIDSINILQATQESMHKSISKIIENHFCKNNLNNEKINNEKINNEKINKDKINNSKIRSNYKLLIDGNYFKSFHPNENQVLSLNYTCIEGGDNKYTTIAAASILAKVARDQYIEELCDLNPDLDLHYGIRSNKGYGAKKHIEGIKEHGITIWHRRSFGICKSYLL